MSQRQNPRVGWVTWVGLGVVLAAAAVLSFHALFDLGIAVGIPAHLAWLLPIAVDAGAAVSCATWLSRRAPADATRWARGQTWALLTLTVAGNAAGLGMHAAGIVPPWWVAVLVGAIPPAVVGGCVHLAVLVGRAEPTAVGEPVGDDSDGEDWDRIDLPAPDSAIVAHLRRWAADRAARGDRPPSRDDMISRYRIGAPRATRIRRLMAWPTVPTAEPVEPTGAAR